MSRRYRQPVTTAAVNDRGLTDLQTLVIALAVIAAALILAGQIRL